MRIVLVIFIITLTSQTICAQDYSWESILKKAQTDGSKKEVKKEIPDSKITDSKSRLVTYEIIDGDTIPVISLPDLVIMDEEYKKKYDYHLRYIKRMYPYARLIAEMTEEFDSSMTDMEKRKEKRKYIDQQKDAAMAQFEEAVKKMSINDGKYLVKLIHRECGMPAYDVISKYIGSTKTFFWQTASRLGGADLKIKYDPAGADKMIEEIVKKIEKGEIKVKKMKLDPNAVEKKEAAEALEKKKKKEEKKSKSKK